MSKRPHHANNPQVWLQHVADIRGDKNVRILHTAIDLYDKEAAPLLEKGVAIADILLSLELDNETLASALIYPALQADEILLETITDSLGESSSKLLHDVMQMQSLGKLQHVKHRNHQVENLRKMLLAMVTDVRSILIVLAERVWQLHQAKRLDEAERKKLAQETFDVYAPLANRIGVWQLKWEIEDLCLRYLQPEIYENIAKWLASRRVEREAFIKQAMMTLTEKLEHAGSKNFKVYGRVKHIYSIYSKMERKNASFEKIYDISALRVLVPTIEDCYAVLSVLQNNWQQVPEEFDDYISQPKSNGYRSIHTVIIDEQKRFIEVQIRTYQMHEDSELGVAAHWRYKEGVLQVSGYEAKIALLRQIMAWQKEVVHMDEAGPGQLAQDLFAEHVYVFTPTGDIIDLPNSATPLDFAYHIHSEVGHRCRGAKVDGHIVPLTYHLQTGERVEVLTAKEPNPSRDWLNPHLGYLNTPRARAKVQHWFRMKDGLQNTITGRELLEKELKKIGFSDKPDLNAVAAKLEYKSGDDMLAAIAAGEIRIPQIIHHLHPPHHAVPEQAQEVPAGREPSGGAPNIQILGISNLLTHVANCCKPLPGDPIIGYVTRNRGVSIHRRDCSNVANIVEDDHQRLMEVSWGDTHAGGAYPADLLLRVHDRTGLLRDITTLLGSEKINILGLQAQKTKDKDDLASIYLTIEITNKLQLKKALEILHQIPQVLEVRRR